MWRFWFHVRILYWEISSFNLLHFWPGLTMVIFSWQNICPDLNWFVHLSVFWVTGLKQYKVRTRTAWSLLEIKLYVQIQLILETQFRFEASLIFFAILSYFLINCRGGLLSFWLKSLKLECIHCLKFGCEYFIQIFKFLLVNSSRRSSVKIFR
jgi:hypothetical protein